MTMEHALYLRRYVHMWPVGPLFSVPHSHIALVMQHGQRQLGSTMSGNSGRLKQECWKYVASLTTNKEVGGVRSLGAEKSDSDSFSI